MRASYAATVVLVLLYASFLALWSWSGTQLPASMATHFNGSGVPNGWMSRSDSQTFMLLFGLVFPLFFIGLCYATRFLPASLVNLPNRQYWLDPARKNQTSNYLVRHSLWLACLAVGFIMGIEYSLVQANRQTPPHLSLPLLLGVLLPFMAGTLLWVLLLLRHFRRPS